MTPLPPFYFMNKEIPDSSQTKRQEARETTAVSPAISEGDPAVQLLNPQSLPCGL